MFDQTQLLELAATYGTPLYVYSADRVVEQYKSLYKYIPYSKLQVHYALKANYNVALLAALRDAGAALDTVSPGEVQLALALGFAPEKIIFTANNLKDEEVAEVKALGVLFNIGSISRLEKFGRAYPGSRVCVRFNPDVVDGENAATATGGDLAKFGILMQDVDKVVDIARQYDLHIVGLHEHTGSGLQHTESVFQSMKNLMGLAGRERFPELEFLDFGGGFKVPYKPDEAAVDYAAMGAEIVRLFEDFCQTYGKALELKFEPGKYMVAQAGVMLTTVNTLKFNRTRTIAGCDAGFPQLIRPVFYGAYHQIENLSNPDGERKVYDVCGNICESGDRFAEQRELPEIREYDVLAIYNAGAYCYSMGGVYNLRSMPGEVVISNGNAKLVRKRLSNQELVSNLLAESLV
ncbi:MAG: diaminopimelate decarboxylase [Lentisphaerae bacterium]|nr:diaminopimelate decarboxylase [Lentisphaerota bacterium]